MALALTKVIAYGVEAEETVNKRYLQRLVLAFTAANTDVTWDFGTYAGTFWTAVGATEPGVTALAAIADIQSRAYAFHGASGKGISDRRQAQKTTSAGVVTALTSAVYAGGSATPTLTVTGLLTTDTILGVSQVVKNANSLPILGSAAACTVADQYGVTYSADPGGTGSVRVAVLRAGVATLLAGEYRIAMDGTNTLLPNISFLTTDGPTSAIVCLEWLLKDGAEPVSAYKAA